MTKDRYGNYQFTAMGDAFWPLDPREEDLDIRTIAHHLAAQCRYNGAVQHKTHTDRIFYSVAEHSVLCSHACNRYPHEALMHDAAEAYIGDLIRPLKVHVKFDHYRFIETRLESVIAKRFKLEYDHDKFLWPQEVLDVDEDMALTETDQIIKMNDGHPTNNQLNTGKKLLPIKIMMREPWAAMQLFLNRCDDLGLM